MTDSLIQAMVEMQEAEALQKAEQLLAEGIDAIRTLYSMGDGQGDECFLTTGEGPLSEGRIVVFEESVRQLSVAFGYLGESFQVSSLIIGRHRRLLDPVARLDILSIRTIPP